MRAKLVVFPLLLAAIAGGCQSRGDSTPGESSGAETRAASADAGPAAEAMCREHGVLEAVCTKCNPKLIPIFQAKGDWCAEHEFPESFCPVCHPEMGGKPRNDVAADEAPADGLRVKFATKEVAAQVGIESTAALRGEEARTIVATATIVADASRSALVNLRAPGVIREFKVDLGTSVKKGTPLAVIESKSVAEDRARLHSARARVEATEANYERETQLHEKGISAQKDVQAAQQALEEAKADLAAASAAVGMIGEAEGGSAVYTLLAPIAGVVTARHFTVGTLVDPDETILEILDTSSLWAEIEIPESQASRVLVGQRVLLEIDGVPDRTFEGTLRYVAPLIDSRTRTVKARATVGNRDGALRANMYGRAHISIASAEGSALVPRAAVQEAKGVKLVFVPLSIDEYETRRVRVAPSDGDLVVVTAGLLPGERVVTTGSFLLKTETLKESIGAGCCEVEEPK
jgi:cobalt-zinc-cadmium efflux system membrane fusion protein